MFQREELEFLGVRGRKPERLREQRSLRRLPRPQGPVTIGVRFGPGLPGSGGLHGCLGRKIDGPGLLGGLIFYQGQLFPLKGHL